jgi:uncharacterized membrane protein (DUF2068 family)
MASRDIDPEQAVSIAAILLFINAAFTGLPALQVLTNAPLSGLSLLVSLLLAAGMVTAGVGLLQGRRWGWYLGVVVAGLLAVYDLLRIFSLNGLISLFFDVVILWFLAQPRVRARFGVR